LFSAYLAAKEKPALAEGDEMSDVAKNLKDGSPAVEWDMSRERSFIETLLGQRLSFLLVFVSISGVGGINAKEPIIAALVFSVAAWVTGLLAVAIYRTSRKLECILRCLDETHPARAKEISNLPTGRHIVGQCVPLICTGALTFAAVCAWSLVFKSAN
jgi:hypothetical protein